MKQKLLILLLLFSVIGNIVFLYQINTMRSSLSDINSQTKELTSAIVEKDKTIESMNTSVLDLQTKLAGLQSKYDALLIANEGLKKSNELLEIEKTNLQNDIKNAEIAKATAKPTEKPKSDPVVDAYIDAERQAALDKIAAMGGGNTGTNSTGNYDYHGHASEGVTLE